MIIATIHPHDSVFNLIKLSFSSSLVAGRPIFIEQDCECSVNTRGHCFTLGSNKLCCFSGTKIVDTCFVIGDFVKAIS